MLTDDEMDFLNRLKLGTRLKLADRKEDKIRQKMRRLGYAYVIMGPRRWVLTDKGWKAVEGFSL